MRTFRFRSEVRLPRPIDEVFPFFADALNLEQLTPPWLRFEVVTPAPIAMRAGTLIDYRLRVRGVPIRWRSEITEWNPPYGFVDEQRRGPYRLWRHVHAFEADGDDTVVRDAVDYAVPGGWLAWKLLVRRDVETIFAYRRAVLERRFEPRLSGTPAPPLHSGSGARVREP